jgi:hypothetical protein
MLGLSATACALVLGLATSPAEGASSSTVAIPLHPVSVGLHLIGASATGVAVRQSSIGSGEPVFTGALGTELTRRTAPDATIYSQPGTMLGVTGSTLTWYRHQQRAGSAPKEAHRLNLLTGTDIMDGEIAEPDAFNGESWFSDTYLGTSEMRPPRPLRQYHTGPSGITRTDVLVPDQEGVLGTVLAADRTSVLWAHRTQDPFKPYVLELIDLKSRTTTRVLDTAEQILDVELTADTLVWSQVRPEGGYTIRQRPRAGGAVATYTETATRADVAHLAAGTAGVGYLVPSPVDWDPAKLVVVQGSTAHTVDLEPEASGLAAVGDHFFTAMSRYNPGVFRIDGDEVTRVATVPAATLAPQQLSLSAGTLRYRDLSTVENVPGNGMWERTVTDGKRPTFSAERCCLPQLMGPMAFSAARGVAGVPDHRFTWQFLDRGVPTEAVEAVGVPNISGPYTLIGGKVFRPDGELLFTEPMAAGTTKGADDLFGSQLVYVRTATTGTSTIWWDDAERSLPALLAEVPSGCPWIGPQVSIWGELVAWTSGCGDQAWIRNLQTQTTRVVAIHDSASEIVLSEGILTWRHAYDTETSDDHVLDLTSPTSVPVALPGRSSLLSVDDHLVARLVKSTPSAVSLQAEMMPLPFRPKYQPRLISRNAPLGFTPDGDGHRDVWPADFDLTKPMRSVRLKIVDPAGTTTLATLDGTAPDGSVRDISWNGLTGKGKQLPPGTYHWTLTGRASDGDGSLIAADGSTSVTGTIEINRS